MAARLNLQILCDFNSAGNTCSPLQLTEAEELLAIRVDWQRELEDARTGFLDGDGQFGPVDQICASLDDKAFARVRGA